MYINVSVHLHKSANHKFSISLRLKSASTGGNADTIKFTVG